MSAIGGSDQSLCAGLSIERLEQKIANRKQTFNFFLSEGQGDSQAVEGLIKEIGELQVALSSAQSVRDSMRDRISTIPGVVFTEVLKYLDGRSLAHVSSVNKRSKAHVEGCEELVIRQRISALCQEKGVVAPGNLADLDLASFERDLRTGDNITCIPQVKTLQGNSYSFKIHTLTTTFDDIRRECARQLNKSVNSLMFVIGGQVVQDMSNPVIDVINKYYDFNSLNTIHLVIKRKVVA